MSDPLEDKRPTLFELWKAHHFCVEKLYLKQGDGHKKNMAIYRTAIAMLRNQPVTLAAAKQVLAAVSKMLGIDASVETVRVALLPEPVPAPRKESKDARQSK